jgi:hypothetical protein
MTRIKAFAQTICAIVPAEVAATKILLRKIVFGWAEERSGISGPRPIAGEEQTMSTG